MTFVTITRIIFKFIRIFYRGGQPLYINDVNESWLDHQGIKISFHLYSSSSSPKPALLLIHGFLSSKFSFRDLIPELINDFDIYTFDFPPFGNSDKKKTYNFSYRNFAQIIIELLDYHSIESAYVGGHSMGGQIALLSAYHYPDRIKKLFLFAPSTYMKKANFWFYHLTYLPGFPYVLKRMLYRKGVYNTLTQCVFDHHMITKEMIQGYLRPFLNQEVFPCLTKMIRDREGDLSEDLLRKIKTESFIFWGKEDRILPVTLGYELVQHLPNAYLQTFEKTGHLLPEEVPHLLGEKMIQQLHAK